MIPNVTRLRSASTLMNYLVGPGREGEHHAPHIVAGMPLLIEKYDERELTQEDAADIAQILERNQAKHQKRVAPGHMWHCSLTLKKGVDSPQTAAQWGEISTSFLREMKFIDVPGVPDVPFIVVDHGVSRTGNHHVEFAVSLVRSDGTVADVGNDFNRAQAACRKIEQERGLLQVAAGFGARYATPAETLAAEIDGRPEEQFKTAARRVRACATRSATEAEFVSRCRGVGLLVKPDGGPASTKVDGYSVALDPKHESNLPAPDPEKSDAANAAVREEWASREPVYTKGGKLANDLSLGTLRRMWHKSPEDDRAAFREWQFARFGVESDQDVRLDQKIPLKVLMATVHAELDARGRYLDSLGHDEHEKWRREAAVVAGELASWSWAVEGPRGGPLSRLSDSFGLAAQVSKNAYRSEPDDRHNSGWMGKATDVVRAWQYGWSEVLVQYIRRAQQIHEHLRVRGDQVKADNLRATAQAEFRVLREQMRPPENARALGAVTIAQAYQLTGETPDWYRLPGRILQAQSGVDKRRLEETLVRDMTVVRDTGKLDTVSAKEEWARHTGDADRLITQGPGETLVDYLKRKDEGLTGHWDATSEGRAAQSEKVLAGMQSEAVRVLNGQRWGVMENVDVKLTAEAIKQVEAELAELRGEAPERPSPATVDPAVSAKQEEESRLVEVVDGAGQVRKVKPENAWIFASDEPARVTAEAEPVKRDVPFSELVEESKVEPVSAPVPPVETPTVDESREIVKAAESVAQDAAVAPSRSVEDLLDKAFKRPSDFEDRRTAARNKEFAVEAGKSDVPAGLDENREYSPEFMAAYWVALNKEGHPASVAVKIAEADTSYLDRQSGANVEPSSATVTLREEQERRVRPSQIHDERRASYTRDRGPERGMGR